MPIRHPIRSPIRSVVAGPVTFGIYTDTFNRANANLDDSLNASGGWRWTHDGLIAAAANIASSQIRGNTALSTGSAYTAATLPTANQYVQFTVGQVVASPGGFFCCRMADRDNFVGIRSRSTNIEVYRVVAAAFTQIYAGTGLSELDAVLRLVVQGSNFTVYKNGALLTGPTAIGAVFTSRNVGIMARAATGVMGDNFEAGPV